MNGTLRDRLQDVAEQHLPRALAELLEPLCAEQDESIWMIRRLELSFGADIAWGVPKLARCWAAGLAQCLFKTMQSERDGQSVYHYRSRSEYVAAFVTELAEGTAWNKWQYKTFEGLRSLSSSSALRTLLVREPETVLRALAMLTPSTLQRVAGVLLSHDAEQIWSYLTAASAQPSAAALGHAVDVWQSERWRSHASPWVEALRLAALTLSAGGPGDGASDWREAVSAVVAIAALETLRAQTAAEAWPEMEVALVSGRIGNLPRAAWAIAGDALQYWIGHPALLQRAASILADCAAEERERTESRGTPFGAVFLLLPLIEELPAEAWSAEPGLLKFAVFVRCCAANVRQAARRDDLLRDLFGVAPDRDLEDLTLTTTAEEIWNWMRETEHPAREMQMDTDYLGGDDTVAVAAHAVLRGFAWKLPGFGLCSLPHLWTNFLDIRASVDLEPKSIVVRMTAPPLQVILRLAGLTSGAYTLPRIDPRPFRLFQEA